MKNRNINMGAGHSQGLWPVLGVLLLAVLVPTTCVLWFANAAMSNERLAVRQRLADAYREKLLEERQAIDAFWVAKMELPPALDRSEATMRAWGLLLFHRIVRDGQADSVITLDDEGRPAYPTSPSATITDSLPASPDWMEARRLEFEEGDYQQAAEAYARVAGAVEVDDDTHAQALLAQGRCLIHAGQLDAGLEILLKRLSVTTERQFARDPFGRCVFIDAQLLALQSLPRDDARFKPLAWLLARQVSNYGGDPVALPEPVEGMPNWKLYAEAAMPAPQRLMMMEMLSDLPLDGVSFPTLPAERLAQQYLTEPSAPAEPDVLTATGAGGLWQISLSDRHVILLFREETLISALTAAAALDEPFAGATMRLLPPGDRNGENKPFMTIPASSHLPDWQLAAYLDGDDPFTSAARRRNALYLWTAAIGITIILAAAALLARYVARQMALTRLKNDLIATVSHELKTPLASMRVLVDTMLEGRTAAPEQAGQYLRLIARENERLSRLIDSFLTFSRMERNKKVFACDDLSAADLVAAATDALAERFVQAGCKLETNVQADLPPLLGDRDALTTVLVNLLDNALKYSGDKKHIRMEARAEDGEVCLAVTDNGIGMTRRTARRVFDRFYQGDQLLSRAAGGCGLGLSIVRFIVDAHGGRIDLATRPGKGSTFTVRLSAERTAAAMRGTNGGV